MTESTTEIPERILRDISREADPAEGWAEYQSVLRYLTFHGKELQPTARLILLSMVGHEAHTLQVVFETGACHYAVNRGLADLTNRGLLLRKCSTLGRFKHSFYRINKSILDQQCNSFSHRTYSDLLTDGPMQET